MMGWTPARLYTASQWAKNVRDIRSEEGPRWRFQRLGSTWAKSVFAVSGADRRGKVVMGRHLRRAQVLEFMGKLGPCVVGREACGGAHHWARAIGKLGHEVR